MKNTPPSRLIVFGDSMTYGHGLEDADNHGNFTKPSCKTWANTVANYWGIECINKAIPGSGNDSILRNLHSYFLGVNPLDNKQDRFNILYQPGDIIIVGLSMLFRMEVCYNNNYIRLLPTSEYNGDKKLYDSYKYIVSMVDTDALYVKLVQDIFNIHTLCSYYGVPVVIFKAIPSHGIFNRDNEMSDTIFKYYDEMTSKTNLIKDIMHGYISKNLGNSAFLPCWHPNEIGHKFWGEYVIRYIEDNGILR